MSLMYKCILVTALCFTYFSIVEATCTNSNSNCATWTSNGFCASTFYTCAQKQSYCASSCNIGGCSPQTTCSTTGTTCVNSNTNCATWTTNGFCASTFYTTAQKCSYCSSSCSSLCCSSAVATTTTTTTTAAAPLAACSPSAMPACAACTGITCPPGAIGPGTCGCETTGAACCG